MASRHIERSSVIMSTCLAVRIRYGRGELVNRSAFPVLRVQYFLSRNINAAS